ncbi:MAG: serine O-acetyltransferase EpsC [Candidatus Aenigmatarchaeota archaeon]
MGHTYTGNVMDKIIQSYQSDGDLFIHESNLIFSDIDCNFKELKLIREILFPNYWNCGQIEKDENKLKNKLNDLGRLFLIGILPHIRDENKARITVTKIIDRFADVREMLKKDAEAAYKGDPAAKDYTEIIRSYPGFCAILVQRVAHMFYELGEPTYARELMERIHSLTGIDIHPGAKIGEHFFMDHGTGIVVGETTVIGNWVRMYQGVTLGALHFMKDSEGQMLKKGYKRHPTIGDNVVVGVGAKILGPVKIGNNVSVGANSWIEEDVPDNTTVFISEHPKLMKKSKK